jgi:hypothetical protein
MTELLQDDMLILDMAFYDAWHVEPGEQDNLIEALVSWSRRSKLAFVISVRELKRDIDRDITQESDFLDIAIWYYEGLEEFVRDNTAQLLGVAIPEEVKPYIAYDRIVLSIEDDYQHTWIGNIGVVYSIP